VGATIGAAIDQANAELITAGFQEPRRQARRLLAAALGLSAAEVFAHPERQLAAVEEARVAAMLRRLVSHEPLSRITGQREFWGLDFLLSADTLDPRAAADSDYRQLAATLPNMISGAATDSARPR